jgi:hypothetical protein
VTPEEARDARHLKRLEMLQAIIARMAQNSFVIKGWATTFCSALLALGAKDANARFTVLAVLPAGIFWCLDAYYLSLERRYRALYESAAGDLGMTLSLGDARQAGAGLTVEDAMWARAVWPIYLLIIALSAGITCYAYR